MSGPPLHVRLSTAFMLLAVFMCSSGTEVAAADAALASRISAGHFLRPEVEVALRSVPLAPTAATLANEAVSAPARGLKNEVVGLYYFRNRMYDPSTGRFLQRDPVWDPVNLGNPYTFVGNSPVSVVDPTGEWAFLIPIVVEGLEWAAISGATVLGSDLIAQEVTQHNAEGVNWTGDQYSPGAPQISGKAAGYGFIGGATFGAGSAGLGALGAPPLLAESLAGGASVGAMDLARGEVSHPIWYAIGFGAPALVRGALSGARGVRSFLEDPSGLGRAAETASKAAFRELGAEMLPSRLLVGKHQRLLSSSHYSVAFEARLQRGVHYPDLPEGAHFAEANRQLHLAFMRDTAFAEAMESLYPGINRARPSTALRRAAATRRGGGRYLLRSATGASASSSRSPPPAAGPSLRWRGPA